MPRPTYLSEENGRFDDEDAAQMERRICRVAGGWGKRLRCDQAYDIEDLEQELRRCYWLYWRMSGHPEHDSQIRKWARTIIRTWGYRGTDHDDKGLFHNDRCDSEVSMSRSALTREFDLTDEEIIDRANFKNESGWSSDYDEP